jgi:hypothetical protein
MRSTELLDLIANKPDCFVQIIKAKHRDFYDRVCVEYDGVKFSEKIYIHMYGKSVCKACGGDVKFTSFIRGYNQYCSPKCSNSSSMLTRVESRRKTLRQTKYEEKKCLVCAKQFDSLISRNRMFCGNKCSSVHTANDPIRLNKMRQTKLQRYGDPNYVNLVKSRKTNLIRYGSENVFSNENIKREIRDKQRTSNYKSIISRLETLADIIPLFDIDTYVSTERENEYEFKCKSCNEVFLDHIDGGHLPRCLECNPTHQRVSGMESELCAFIDGIVGSEVIHNDRSILDGKELDIYIPSKKIAIEFNGIYWHGETSGGKGRKYHIDKTNSCEAKGIQLIHVFEDEWINKKNLIKKKLIHILHEDLNPAIYARKCDIRVIEGCNDFLELYHVQGKCPSKIKLGAFYEGEMVAAMTFSNLRRSLGNSSSKPDEYELLRFASSRRVVGISSKLFKFFTRTYNPSEVITYADRRYSKGGLYGKLDFTYESTTKPNYWYFKKGTYIRYHRYAFAKHTLALKLEIYDGTLTEWQNMQLNGYDRIWDVGSIKYKWVNSIN